MPLKALFLVILNLGVKHEGEKFYKVYISDDDGMILTSVIIFYIKHSQCNMII